MQPYPATTPGVPDLARHHRPPRRSALALGIALAFAACMPIASASPVESPQRAPAHPGLPGIDALLAAQRAVLASRLEPDAPTTPHGAIPVGNCNDSGAGSLREALAIALDGDVVDASHLTCSLITLTTGQIAIPANNVTVLGPGPGALTVSTTNGVKYYNRIFEHQGSGVLNILGMTIADGNIVGSAAAPDAFGGCIHSAGTVLLGPGLATTGKYEYDVVVRNCGAYSQQGEAAGGGVFAENVFLVNSIVSDCSVVVSNNGLFGGGGVRARTELRMFSSELANNSAADSKYGGGASVGDSSHAGYIVISGSTISGNSAKSGSGFMFAGGVAHIVNSTISGNDATEGGGAIAQSSISPGASSLTISSSTITGNQGRGLTRCEACPAELQSTIVAGNGTSDIAGGPALGGANNLVGAATLDTPTLPPGTIVGHDPRLGPLARNGGRTRTHALQASSPAIGSGNNAYGSAYDQRGYGYPRVFGNAPDIGAVELGDRIFRDGFD